MGLEFTFGERSSADAIGKLKSSLQVEFFLVLRFLTPRHQMMRSRCLMS
jgi:hypothetical protein